MKPLRLARLLAAARWGDIDLEAGSLTLGPDERTPFRVRPCVPPLKSLPTRISRAQVRPGGSRRPGQGRP